MWKKLFSICIVILVSALSGYAVTTKTGDWSETVNGVQGRLIVSEDQPSNGTGIVAVYVELRNVSHVLENIEVYFDPTHTFKCRLLGADDKSVESVMLPASVFVPHPFWLTLPYDSSLRFRISEEGYGIPRNERALIPLDCGQWIIKAGDKSEYKLEVTFTVNPPKVDIDRPAWKGVLKLPKVEVLPKADT